MTMETKSLFIDGRWQRGDGPEFVSTCPSTGQILWEGRESSAGQVAEAFAAARNAFGKWWDHSQEQRIQLCLKFADFVKTQGDELAELISREMGKTRWESKTEVATVVAKIPTSIEALKSRRETTQFELAGLHAVTRFKPFGALAVLGPFNFPAHLPNGHIVPSLLAGNTIVFKPSEQTPAVGEWLVKAWEHVGLPPGVINLVQGGRNVGVAVSQPHQCDGLLFTGSGQVGRALHRAFGDFPQKILALEMGGNNPLVVDRVKDLEAAAYQTVLSAYITSGQRCTCARRLILVEQGNDVDGFLRQLIRLISRVQIGYYCDESEPFYGTVINARSGQSILSSYQRLIDAGGVPLTPMNFLRDNTALLTPGMVDVSAIKNLEDEEVFGPLLNVRRVKTFDDAIQEANDTKYGLSAGLLCDDANRYREFIHRIHAGIVNWNRQTTGASGKLPFGGCGLSGNSRPAGFFSADYCSYPVASLEASELTLPAKLETGINP